LPAYIALPSQVLPELHAVQMLARNPGLLALLLLSIRAMLEAQNIHKSHAFVINITS